jgi:hypothetical protein
MWKQGGAALDRTPLSLGEAAGHLADRRGLPIAEAKAILDRAFHEHTLPLSSLSHSPRAIHAVDVEDAEIDWKNSEVRRQALSLGVSNYDSSSDAWTNVFVDKKGLQGWIELNTQAQVEEGSGAKALAATRVLGYRGKGSEPFDCARDRARAAREFVERIFLRESWSLGNILSWIAFHDPALICKFADRQALLFYRIRSDGTMGRKRQVMLVSKPDHLLLAALRARRLKAFRNGKKIRRRYWVDKDVQALTHDLHFRRAEVMAINWWSETSDEAAPAAAPEPPTASDTGDTANGPEQETSAEEAGAGIDEPAQPFPDTSVVDPVPEGSGEAEKRRQFLEWGGDEKKKHKSFPPMQPSEKGRLSIREWAVQNGIKRKLAEGWAKELGWARRRGRPSNK